MNENEVKKLYNALLNKGYSIDDLGDESTFKTKMGDKNSRKELYDWVSSKGNFRIGDYDAYENRLTLSAEPMQSESDVVDKVEETTLPSDAQPWQPTEKEKMEMVAETDRMMHNVKTHTQAFNERMDNMQEYGLNPGLQKIGRA